MITPFYDIELFDGSMESLERMTGERFDAMKKDGKLLKICVESEEIRTISAMQLELRTKAREIEADALVEVQYVNRVQSRHSYQSGMYGSGYAVQFRKK